MKKAPSFSTTFLAILKSKQMIRGFGMSLMTLCILCSNFLFGQIVLQGATLTRNQYNIAVGTPGYTSAPVVIKLSGNLAGLSTSSTQTFNVGSTYSFAYNLSKIDVSMENGAFTSSQTSPGAPSGPFYLPATLNGETEIMMYNSNYQYGYGVFVKKTGSYQYAVSVRKYTCLNCPPTPK